MAVLVTSGMGYGEWLRFVSPVWAALMVLGAAATMVALAAGLS
jgi:uncharacterized ion transporter superfamily protein YfcC